MTLELGAIIAIALSATSALSSLLRIPKKLRSWTAFLLVIVLNSANDWLFQTTFDWRTSLLTGISAGLATIGIHSASKNTAQHFQQKKTKQEWDDNIPYV
ncbi:hypothetical protein [Brevibacillus fulvus]|uniref:Holin n=1 Tax=Brevibacillus fulvus TaxID=1125967 RepID=A0A939BRM4_9BACL|nr:hypothetical protein [Brevibacillus fulvus]MBM7589787.1 hypothetical protein [Brevibacillus fulvus]